MRNVLLTVVVLVVVVVVGCRRSHPRQATEEAEPTTRSKADKPADVPKSESSSSWGWSSKEPTPEPRGKVPEVPTPAPIPDPKPIPEPEPEVKDTKAYTGVFSEYKDNHILADKKYKGKIAEVRCELVEIISTKNKDEFVLVLALPWGRETAYHVCRCDIAEVERVKVHDRITVHGTVDHFDNNRLYLNNSTVVKVERNGKVFWEKGK